MKEKISEWLKFASIDLHTAEKIVDDENLSASTAFHAQQCVEKCFKAIIEGQNLNVPKIHNLVTLYELVSYKFISDEDILLDMNRVYIDVRYPSMTGYLPGGMPSIQDAARFYEFAKIIYSEVEKYLKEINID